ncbi:hypothetical protein [Streptomyces achromogenes]|uniref:hypothetical protein n=1 Tax=Streptomyces achromogenes TaxID=67255 RepID=UPI0036BAD172
MQKRDQMWQRQFPGQHHRLHRREQRSATTSSSETIPGSTGTLQQRITEVMENEVPPSYVDLATARVIETIEAWQDVLREPARDAAVAKLRSLYSGQIPDSVAREIADAVLGVLTADRVKPTVSS